MRKMRQSMAVKPEDAEKTRVSLTNSIQRASLKYQHKDGADSGELMIENERLKTALMLS